MRHTIVALVLFVTLAICAAQPSTIADVIDADPSFSILSKLLETTGLRYTLSQSTIYTVFAPNNTAFSALPPAALKYLLDANNINALRSVLLYHVAPGYYSSGQLIGIGNGKIASAKYSTVTVTARNPFYLLVTTAISINDARIITSNIKAANGVIHSLDRVLLLDTWQFDYPNPNLYYIISMNPDLSTLKYALDATGLDSVLSGYTADNQYTVFAPTNEAFEDPVLAPLFDPNNRDILKNVLLYHVLNQSVFSTDLFDGQIAATLNPDGASVTVRRTQFPGASSTMIDDATVLTTDAFANSGVLHTINRVLLPRRKF